MPHYQCFEQVIMNYVIVKMYHINTLGTFSS